MESSAKVFGIFVVTQLILPGTADVYLHNPRGSNNRLNEPSANRKNGNRMFDSQNNNRGGYNQGDKFSQSANGNYVRMSYMNYFQSGKTGKSHLQIQWTNQHGCGRNSPKDPIKLNCQLVIQFMCDKKEQSSLPNDSVQPTANEIRDGARTQTIPYKKPPEKDAIQQESEYEYILRKNRANYQFGMNEPSEWRDKCEARERNKGLFTADQKLKKDTATHTRQNAFANRNGLECPEERDYFPYWHPSDWKDIAVLVDDTSRCPFHRSESFNRKPKFECVETFRGSDTPRHYSAANNEQACKGLGGTWTEFYNYLEILRDGTDETLCKAEAKKLKLTFGVDVKFKRPIYGHTAECLVLLPVIKCEAGPFTRANDLSDINTYDWELPYFPSNEGKSCVLRLRYNISSDDYDPITADSKFNNSFPTNPAVSDGNGEWMGLAINTAQYGRTFQDRSHVFKLLPRKGKVPDEPQLYNLNVRGKRGNIVQTFPAVEYDFVPNALTINKRDLVHIQWTGSNSHNNNKPAGDGQAGDDGEGRGGTDRHNILSMLDRSRNFFLPFKHKSYMTNHMETVWSPKYGPQKLSSEDMAILLASAGYYECMLTKNCKDSLQSKTKLQKTLDNAPASFPGFVFRFTAANTYVYGCTRNNNFSNRSQKGHIVVEDDSK